MRSWQSSLLDLRLKIERVWKIAVGKEMRKSIENAGRKIERLANLSGSAPPAVADHVCSHGGTVFPVAAINFLNDGFASVSAREIEIDIRPAFAALVQE